MFFWKQIKSKWIEDLFQFYKNICKKIYTATKCNFSLDIFKSGNFL